MTRAPKGYWRCDLREDECHECGEIRVCNIYQGEMEEETGYRDEIALCSDCDEEEHDDGS